MMNKERSTIHDVARMADVSTATVSHVINNTRFVSEQVAKRVRDAMKETNYRSNYVARALRSSKTKTIGVIIPDITNPFYARMVHSLEMELNKYGYGLILCHSKDDLDRELEQIERLRSWLVDGIMIAPASSTFDYTELSSLQDCPVVYIDRQPNAEQFSGVFCNTHDTVQYAVEQLILSGHRKIACMLGHVLFSTTMDRKKGYIDALEKHGIPINPQYITTGPTTIESGDERMDYLLKASDVTAVFAANRKLSIGAMRRLSASGVKIPEEMAVIGFAAYEWCDITTPALTTVLEPIDDIGAEAARMMHARLTDAASAHSIVRLDAYLTQRSSY